VDLAPDRIVRLAFEPRTAARLTNCFGGSLASIGHGHDFDLRVVHHIEHSFRDILRDLSRVQRAFEFIGSDEDSHTAIVGRLCQLAKAFGVHRKAPQLASGVKQQRSRRIPLRYPTFTSRGSSTSLGMTDCGYAFSFR